MSFSTSRSGGWKRLTLRMVKMNCAPEGGMATMVPCTRSPPSSPTSSRPASRSRRRRRRTIAVYIGLIALLRVGGKRDLAQPNSFDLVVLLLLSNVVQNAIIGPRRLALGRAVRRASSSSR